MSGQIGSWDADQILATQGWIPKYFNKFSTIGDHCKWICSQQYTMHSYLSTSASSRTQEQWQWMPLPQNWSGVTVWLPIFSNDREMSAEDQGGEGLESSDSDPSMEEGTHYSTWASAILASFPSQGSADEPSGRSASPRGSGITHPDYLAGVQQSLESRGISDKAVSLTCISWRWGTEKSYSLAWELWQGWCSKGHINPLSASLSDIANFLQNLRMVNRTPHSTPTVLQYQLLTPQSRLSSRRTSYCLQAASRGVQRTPSSTKVPVYLGHVRVVVEFLKSMAPNEALPYKDLTMKLAALMAITNANRASDLHALDRRFLQKKKNLLRGCCSGCQAWPRPEGWEGSAKHCIQSSC